MQTVYICTHYRTGEVLGVFTTREDAEAAWRENYREIRPAGAVTFRGDRVYWRNLRTDENGQVGSVVAATLPGQPERFAGLAPPPGGAGEPLGVGAVGVGQEQR
jgi:hypothetical protein